MRRLLALFLFALSCNATVSFSVDSTGLTALAYNATSYLYPSWQGGNPVFYYGGSGCATQFYAPSSVATSDNSTYFQNAYGSGTGAATVRITYTATDANTLRLVISTTNNDSTFNICRVTIPALPLTIGANTNTTGNVNSQYATIQDGSPLIFYNGSYGSIAAWTDYGTVGENIAGAAWTTGTQAIYFVQNRILVGPGSLPPQTTYQTQITPGQTLTTTVYLRFGGPSATADTIAPEAYLAYQSGLSPQYYLASRRSACLWYTSSSAARGANNPRGYFYANANTNPSGFLAAGLDLINNQIIPNCNAIHGQVVMIWDLEGQEAEGIDYIGKPSLLSAVAPDMHAQADAFISAITGAGLRVGLTLRPQNLRTGSSLPGTCTFVSTSDPDQQYNDLFYNTANTGYTDPNIVYECRATNTWTSVGSGPFYQTSISTVAGVISMLEAEIDYANGRWGTTDFYVDTSGWPGMAFQYQIWKQIMADRPNIVLWIENYGIAAPSQTSLYLSTNNGYYEMLGSQRTALPGSWAMINYNGTHDSDVTSGMANGDIYLMQAWYDAGHITGINADRAAAVTLNSTLTMAYAPGASRVFTSPAMGADPLVFRTYFAANSGAMAASTTYCQKRGTVTCYAAGVLQNTASLDLTSMTVYQNRLYDFIGGLLSSGSVTSLNPGTTFNGKSAIGGKVGIQ